MMFAVLPAFLTQFSFKSGFCFENLHQESDQPLVIYFFYAHGCSYCEIASNYLLELKEIYPTLEIRGFDVYLDPEARSLYTQVLAYLDRSPQGMPTIIIGDRVWVGFQRSYQQEFISTLNICLETGCTDIRASLVNDPPAPIISSTVQPMFATFRLPLIGEISLSEVPLIISTLIIGIIDGFNPCSLWVLTVLLSLTLYMQSRPKILLIGLTFITISSFVYALFISGLFTVLSVLQFHVLIQISMSLIAIVFAAINIKDYFYFQQGPSLTISDQVKPRLYQRIRHTLSLENSIVSLVIGTIVLSTSVSLMEFSCTAGFPIIWVNLLAEHQVNGVQYLLLLGLYLFIYMFDELIIFFMIVITMRSIKLTAQQGRLLKLLSGLFMLVLAVIMLIKPELMNNLLFVLLIFAAVISITFLIDRIKHHL